MYLIPSNSLWTLRQYLEEGIYWGGSLDNSDYPLFIGILLFPTIVRWILTGKFRCYLSHQMISQTALLSKISENV